MPSRIAFEPSRITLGSAQLGMRYGVANSTGQPTEEDTFRVLDRASALGIHTIDTARSYGSAEDRIGKWLASRKPQNIHIITKIPAVPAGASHERAAFVRAQIAASKSALGVSHLPLVLIHQEQDLLDPSISEELQSAVATREIARFGASVYQVEAARRLMEATPVAALQVPLSIADRRFEQAGILGMAASRGVAVFARSIFLQGALLMSPASIPNHLRPLTPLLLALSGAAQRSGRSVLQLLITAVGAINGVSSLVLGVETADQLEANTRALRLPPIAPDISEELARHASRLPPEILLPGNWRDLESRS